MKSRWSGCYARHDQLDTVTFTVVQLPRTTTQDFAGEKNITNLVMRTLNKQLENVAKMQHTGTVVKAPDRQLSTQLATSISFRPCVVILWQHFKIHGRVLHGCSK